MLEISGFKPLAGGDAEALKALQFVLKRKDLGFHQLPERLELWQSSKNLAQIFRKKFEVMCLIGIGGSSLGPKALYQSLVGEADRRVEFFDNVDIDVLEMKWESLGDSPCFVFISKSGKTIESLATLAWIEGKLAEQTSALSTDNCVIITESGSNPLGDWADGRKINRLEIPKDVGGRFSVLSPVGMFPAGFMGFDLTALRKGAEQARDQHQLIASFATQALASFQTHKSISLFWFYTDLLTIFGEWIVQLWAESLGKPSKIANASTPMCARGATDQHSILQQVQEGPRDKWVVMTTIANSTFMTSKLKSDFPGVDGLDLQQLLKLEAFGTAKALRESHIDVCEIVVDRLSPNSMGYLFMFFELVVATLGKLLEINAFDQPGVELSKRYTLEMLAKS